VHALRNIHAALIPGGPIIDTQPVSAHPPIEADDAELGTLDMRDWARTIEQIDRLTEQTIREGLFTIDEERRFTVTDSYDDGPEFVAEARQWAGTHVGDALANRLAREPRPVRLHQEIRLRVLRALR
jgi:hypothetical protein